MIMKGVSLSVGLCAHGPSGERMTNVVCQAYRFAGASRCLTGSGEPLLPCRPATPNSDHLRNNATLGQRAHRALREVWGTSSVLTTPVRVFRSMDRFEPTEMRGLAPLLFLSSSSSHSLAIDRKPTPQTDLHLVYVPKEHKQCVRRQGTCLQ